MAGVQGKLCLTTQDIGTIVLVRAHACADEFRHSVDRTHNKSRSYVRK